MLRYPLAVLVCATLLFQPAVASAADPLRGVRPNIVLVMPDDMGFADIAAHRNPLIKTPNLDALYAESLRFTDFHVSPTCAPTRSAIMTGRHEFKNGVTHTIYERERMTLDATTLPQVLKSAGYTTGIFGKWHLGDEEPYQPHNRGFDEVFIHGAGGIGQTYVGSCGDAPGNKYFDPAIKHNGTFVKTKGYCTDLFFEQAERWIGDKAQGDAPFFAYITPNAPHGPLISPGDEYDKLYQGKSIKGKKLDNGAVAYYSMITNIDENIGQLRDKLKQWGVANDTLFIFISDNGGTHTRLCAAEQRGGKGSMYQGGTRSPSFWYWPEKIAGGADCPALSAHIDIYRTLAELAAAKLSKESEQQAEGRSLVPLLEDPKAPWEDRTLVTHVGRWARGEAKKAKYSHCAIRNSRYSLVNNKALYDLKNDPGESRDILDGHPEVAAQLREAYDLWWKETLPLMVNENAVGPAVNPFKAAYWKQYGGGPEAKQDNAQQSGTEKQEHKKTKPSRAGRKPK